MSLGADLKEIFTEMGRSYSVVHEGATGATEYGEVIPNTQATKPFIILNFLKMNVPHDTTLTGGDHVVFADGRDYIVTTLNGEYIENAVIKYESIMYKTNDNVLLQRPTDEKVNYVDTVSWATLGTSIPVLLTEALREQELDVDDIGTFVRHGMEMYVSSYLGLQIGDRVTDGNSIKHKVTVVNSNRFDNVDMIKLDRDIRD